MPLQKWTTLFAIFGHLCLLKLLSLLFCMCKTSCPVLVQVVNFQSHYLGALAQLLKLQFERSRHVYRHFILFSGAFCNRGECIRPSPHSQMIGCSLCGSIHTSPHCFDMNYRTHSASWYNSFSVASKNWGEQSVCSLHPQWKNPSRNLEA